MDKIKKSTLEEFMKPEEEEELKAENKADTLMLDEPKKRTWLTVLITLLVVVLVAAGGYVAWQSYKADKALTAEEKIDNSSATNTTTTTTTPTTQQTVYTTATEGLNLRKEASATSEVLKIVPFGTKLVVLETSGDWYKTTYDSATGWIAKLYTSDTDPLVYKNTTYGFQVTFPATWAYKFFPTKAEDGVTAGYYVAVPTADTAIDESSMGVDKGYQSLFAISIYTPSQWDAAKATGEPIPTLAVQNTNYVVAYSLPNGIAGSDLAARVAEVKSVIATIKFY